MIKKEELEHIVAGVVRDVAELPDRTSPGDQPEMMLVSSDELGDIVRRHLEHATE